MQESYRAEGATCYENEGCAVGRLDSSSEAGGGEFILVERHVAADCVGHDLGGRSVRFVERFDKTEGSLVADVRF